MQGTATVAGDAQMSNTEPVIRLNVKSRGDMGLMEEKTTGILALLDAQGA